MLHILAWLVPSEFLLSSKIFQATFFSSELLHEIWFCPPDAFGSGQRSDLVKVHGKHKSYISPLSRGRLDLSQASVLVLFCGYLCPAFVCRYLARPLVPGC